MLSGIYIIQSKLFPDRVYVGSSVNLLKRKKRHFWELATGHHINKKLQNHVNKYGLLDLHFEIVCLCYSASLLSLEQNFIDDFKPYFNINPVAGSRLGTKLSTQAKSRISEASKKMHRLSHIKSLFKISI